MAIPNWQVSITESPLEGRGLPTDEHAGAVVDFWGVVRKSEDGRTLSGIDYEVHRPMAEHQMKLLAEKAMKDFSLLELQIYHRVGFVPVAKASLLVRVTSGHRPAAFAASQWLIDELKRKVPIWKRPVFSDGEKIAERLMPVMESR